MENLQELGNLVTLDLASTKVTDEGLKYLKALKKLKWLDVCDTEVSEAGVAELKQAVPGLNVSHGDRLPFPLPNLIPAWKPQGQPVDAVIPHWVIWLLVAGAIAVAAGGLFRRSFNGSGPESADRPPPFVKLGADGKDGIMYRDPWRHRDNCGDS